MLSVSRGPRRHEYRSEVETISRGPDLLLKATDETSSDGGSTSITKSVEDTGSKDKSSQSLVRTHHVLKIKLKKITNWSGCSGAALDDEPFYHGYMSREEAEKLVRTQGEFLLRKTESTKRGEVVVLSVFWDDTANHLVVEKANNGSSYYLKEFCFENISDLVRYHHQTRASVYKSGIKLFSWVIREEWQLYHEQINLGKKLGNGEFGEVFQGMLSVGIFTNDVEVAVKTMKGSKVTADERIKFLREANLMLKLNHKYVVRLYGVATQQEPIMIVMELCSGGSLKGRIEKDEPMSSQLKRKYCKQIAKGMRYLEKKQVIHRDLAARNVLLDKSDNCKISDFGLSLFGKLHKEKKLMKVPIRWLPPETLLKGIYSSKSDVWSFGVVMFEVFSREYPYSEVKVLKELRKKVAHENLRLKPPSDMPEEDMKVMQMCFEPVESRMSFLQLCKKYKELTSPLPTWNGIANKLIGIGTAV
ncbi:Protein CBG03803 [Caenorhabditis briggsae]|uniref:Tyrosine-protein kinase n=2 Tax=Caenorhabditis briggsae TaxID=6238 RepID=A0AAE9DS98_CAEBR|nr:Protein CBG03803 [Caenorhabditis briggsae]ULU10879.1 hypothetical protein L3Y34_014838 [Caenorhabditis briggsae]UMM11831.1 hypothetical protein L5515_000913 [Caenorhabditis briggsae]CAP24632.2 Protein CBG03803 [Caenorhabditis briggsae]